MQVNHNAGAEPQVRSLTQFLSPFQKSIDLPMRKIDCQISGGKIKENRVWVTVPFLCQIASDECGWKGGST